MQAVERLLDLGEFKVNYAAAGKGESVVLLHGSDHRESWKVWEPLMQLSDGYSVVAPDLIGYGGSSHPVETPDHSVQAHVVRDLLEKLGVQRTNLVGEGWGAQVAMELAIGWPQAVRSLVLISSAYDKGQIPGLQKLRLPSLIIHAEDDMVTQLKAAYLLRDAIGTSRLEMLAPVAKDPREDFRMSHRLTKFRSGQLLQLIERFLADPLSMVAEPPSMENDLRGLALRKEDEEKEGA